VIAWSAALAAAVSLPATATAHHAAAYDETRIVAIDGTVTGVSWANPHVRLTVEVGAPGRGERWLLEGGAVNALERWGIAPTRFAVGDAIHAEGPLSRRAEHAMIAATVRLADGAEIVLRPDVAARLGLNAIGLAGLFPPPATPSVTDPGAADAGGAAADPGAAAEGNGGTAGLFRVWTPRRFPTAGASPLPLTSAARATAAEYDVLEDDPALRCEPPGLPHMLQTPYPIEFSNRGDRIVMRFEEWSGERTIYMNPRNGPPTQDPSPIGVSFGRWEGTTLAIFTTYLDARLFDATGTPLSRAATVLERYTPSADGRTLVWQATVTDPVTFTAPVTLEGAMAYVRGETIKPYECRVLEPSL
jgi:hypothetical protein